ncbi:hypothetical protein POTOM_027248 [Populus tomentosa]|uniref:ERCC4 domain-containing protein n=1 Tax=Populus tomentosa TaxID=118781 RepID=A0A8X7ZB92_POPTO|nr:hypothetical protein POTOM_027248 [Populus tomentosa]
MWNPIILSDEEEGNQKTPLPSLPKKPRTLPDPTILVLDVDDPTPHKSPSFVPETPLSDVSIVKCTFPRIRVPDFDPETLSGNAGLICLESENDEPESAKNWKEKTTMDAGYDEVEERRRWSTSTNFDSVDWLVDANVNQMSGVSSSQPSLSQDDICQIGDCPDKENFSMEQMACTLKEKRKTKVNSARENSADEAVGTKNTKKDERIRLMEEKKLKKEQEKLQKAALKAQAAELKKMEKEMQKWEKGKFALNSIVAEFDTRVIEHGSVGGPLLTRFADKGLTYRVTSNPIERSILWTMSAPEHISQLSREGTDIRYVALVYEAEEFCNLVMSESLLDHVSSVRSRYPSHTICYLTIRLMAYVNKSSSTIMAIKGSLLLVSYCSSTILNATQVALCSEISPSYLNTALSATTDNEDLDISILQFLSKNSSLIKFSNFYQRAKALFMVKCEGITRTTLSWTPFGGFYGLAEILATGTMRLSSRTLTNERRATEMHFRLLDKYAAMFAAAVSMEICDCTEAWERSSTSSKKMMMVGDVHLLKRSKDKLKALAKLTTHFVRVHYRLCTDEAELADHVFGLTRSLASCQFRKKLTQLSVNANGSFIPKDFIDRNLIKKSPWLKALVAIPKVQPRFAIAIWKKYPTMKSLLSVYMDPNKSAEPNAALDTVGRQNIPQLSFVSLQGTSVHEKEFLLENLTTEGFIGGERRVGQICSKRVYRILMAQSGNIITDNVEDGADFFRNHSS